MNVNVLLGYKGRDCRQKRKRKREGERELDLKSKQSHSQELLFLYEVKPVELWVKEILTFPEHYGLRVPLPEVSEPISGNN